MNISKSFDIAFQKMKERKWDKIYVLVDIHDTILEACYHNKEEHKWFPYAKEALEIMSHAQNISLILWSSTHPSILEEYVAFFKENGIKFNFVNKNTDEANTSLSCFDDKTYFNVGIDDKFGFEAEKDWKEIYDYLVEGIRLEKFR
jgi:hypothetical protein